MSCEGPVLLVTVLLSAGNFCNAFRLKAGNYLLFYADSLNRLVRDQACMHTDASDGQLCFACQCITPCSNHQGLVSRCGTVRHVLCGSLWLDHASHLASDNSLPN